MFKNISGSIDVAAIIIAVVASFYAISGEYKSSLNGDVYTLSKIQGLVEKEEKENGKDYGIMTAATFIAYNNARFYARLLSAAEILIILKCVEIVVSVSR